MVPEAVTLFGALLVGLFSSVHCIGMCGGIAGLLGASPVAGGGRRRFTITLLYSVGRLSSYAVAGAAAGLLGQLLAGAPGLGAARFVLQGVAGLFMLLLGLHLAGWGAPLAGLERAGGHLWRHLEPLGRPLFPVRTPGAALLIGLLWGWLPCGLVYSALVWAAASGGPADGALLMAAFGLGTLPSMVAVGLLAGRLRALAGRSALRVAAGLSVMAIGLAGLLMLLMRLAGGGHA